MTQIFNDNPHVGEWSRWFSIHILVKVLQKYLRFLQNLDLCLHGKKKKKGLLDEILLQQNLANYFNVTLFHLIKKLAMTFLMQEGHKFSSIVILNNILPS